MKIKTTTTTTYIYDLNEEQTKKKLIRIRFELIWKKNGEEEKNHKKRMITLTTPPKRNTHKHTHTLSQAETFTYKCGRTIIKENQQGRFRNNQLFHEFSQAFTSYEWIKIQNK